MKSMLFRPYTKSTCVSSGFSLVELLIGVTLLLIVSVGIYRGFVAIAQVLNASFDTITATDLANEQIEIVRNLTYQDIGVQNSLPDGVIPKERIVNRSGQTFTVTTSVLNVDDEFDGTIGGDPNDTSPADYKIVQILVECDACKNFSPIHVTTTVAPKALETSAGNGALFITVFNASGEAVPQADVEIINNEGELDIDISEFTNNDGVLQIVDAPTSTQAYQINVTKSGYTSSQTYPVGGGGNPNPTKTHATVVEGEVTEVSFAIDEASVLNVSSLTPSCVPVGSFDFVLTGSKIIGTDPDVYKFDESLITDGSGELVLNDMEWDTYTVVSSDGSYTLAGITPTPFVVSPGITTDVSFVVAPNDPNHLLVTVLDAETGLPLSSATTTLEAESGDEWIEATGRGFLAQTDWSGGAGQETYTDETKYSSSNSIDIDNPTGQIKLTEFFGEYTSSGTLTSSTFDTGSESNFHRIRWEPGDQPVESGVDSVRLQFASSASSSPSEWNFIGPDGTSGTYYSVSDSSLFSGHDDDRYVRYKMYLSTEDVDYTPSISDVSFIFTSDCTPAGQSFFDDLNLDDYTLTIEKDGYETNQAAVTVGSVWEHVIVNLSPSS